MADFAPVRLDPFRRIVNVGWRRGELWAWGGNAYGQLGLGTTADKYSPVHVDGLSWRSVAAGKWHSIGIASDGSLYGWGYVRPSLPTKIGSKKWSMIAAGGEQSAGISKDGGLYWWTGGSTNTSPAPYNPTLAAAGAWKFVAAGGFSTYTGPGRDHGWHYLAINDAGQVYVWGDNTFGKLGTGEHGPLTGFSLPPRLISTPPMAHVAAGGDHSLGITMDGELYAWGANHQGQLGLGDDVLRNTPTPVPGLLWSNVSAANCGSFALLGGVVGSRAHSLGVTTDGDLYAWGHNNVGQLGTGDTIDRNTPTLIGSGWMRAAAGDRYSVALREDGRLYTWGLNTYGALGYGGTDSSSTPILVGAGFSGMAAGDTHVLALKRRTPAP